MSDLTYTAFSAVRIDGQFYVTRDSSGCIRLPSSPEPNEAFLQLMRKTGLYSAVMEYESSTPASSFFFNLTDPVFVKKTEPSTSIAELLEYKDRNVFQLLTTVVRKNFGPFGPVDPSIRIWRVDQMAALLQQMLNIAGYESSLEAITVKDESHVYVRCGGYALDPSIHKFGPTLSMVVRGKHPLNAAEVSSE